MKTVPHLPESPMELMALMETAAVKLADVPFACATEDELLSCARTGERIRRRLDGADAALLVEISDRGAFWKAGCRSLQAFLAQDLRLGPRAARARKLATAAIGRFTSMTGDPRDPMAPSTAEAVHDGAIGTNHVIVIDKVMTQIPNAVPTEVTERAEAQLADAARSLTPESLTIAGKRLRGLSPSPQDQQLMSKLRGEVTPELRAMLEVVFTRFAAPGMNNPADPDSPSGAVDQPGLDDDALAAATERDLRTQSQRNHDALLAMCEYLIAGGAVGKPDRIPAELVITVTDRELADRTGLALTATGLTYRSRISSNSLPRQRLI
nr:DUF222 domain-containing protein [Gordonia zhaorongruii]